MLQQTYGVSHNAAAMIAQAYPSLQDLHSAYDALELTDGKQLLASIPVSDEHKLGAALLHRRRSSLSAFHLQGVLGEFPGQHEVIPSVSSVL